MQGGLRWKGCIYNGKQTFRLLQKKIIGVADIGTV